MPSNILPVPLSVIILTYNEEVNIKNCLNSLSNWKENIFVIDSGSTDQTVAIAYQFGCQVFEHPFKNQAEQMNWALQNLPITTPWVMRLDADERLTPELVEELKQVLPQTAEDISGYQVKRRVYFLGHWIRYGGYYPTWLLRIWRAGLGTYENRLMDEHLILSQGQVANLQHDIIDDNQKDLSFWIDKHNRYADRYVKQYLKSSDSQEKDFLNTGLSSQAHRRRWIQQNLYDRTPLFLRAFLYFVLRYFIGLGFLDGVPGLIFHFLQGFWYRFIIDAKLYESDQAIQRQYTGRS